MKIVKIIGGLGNQMFQYSLFISLKETFPNEKIYVDCSYLSNYKLHNGEELQRVFGIQLEQACLSDLLKLTWPLKYYRLWQIGKRILPRRRTECFESLDCNYDETILTLKGNRYFDGYWQGDHYLKKYENNIREIFKFKPDLDVKNSEFIRFLRNTNSVSIHIRRGDYLNHNIYKGICDLGYYIEAIEYIKKNVQNPTFIIFSNDIDWCKMNLLNYVGNDTVFVDWNKGKQSYVDMQMMSLCKHNIIANSSFSWWGAWLNEHNSKIVVAPKKWLNMELKASPQVKGWYLI